MTPWSLGAWVFKHIPPFICSYITGILIRILLSISGNVHPNPGPLLNDDSVVSTNSLSDLLSSNTLERIYISFIRPLLEYADVVWSNCTLEESNMLEAVQVEAARIILGVTKLCNISKMYDDLGWESLLTRREKHRLILFYKMKNNLTPAFLSELVPAQVHTSSSYSLRNADDYLAIHSRTNLYRNSFLPSAVRDWNNLSSQIKSSATLSIFKSNIKKKHPYHPYLHYCNRKSQVAHSRLRLNCSFLNEDLHRRSLVDSPACRCGLPETTHHFFFACPLFTEQRLVHLSDLPCHSSVSNLMYGSPDLSQEQNELLHNSVSNYIHATKRFEVT